MEHRIILTGLKTKGFRRTVEAIKDIDVRMSREAPGHWKDWKPYMHSDHATVTLSCRLLTPASQCETTNEGSQYTVPNEFDPDGVLFGLLASQKYKILAENTLSLYRLKERDGFVSHLETHLLLTCSLGLRR